MAAVEDPHVTEVAWRLPDLVDGAAPGEEVDARVVALLEEADERAERFAAQHAGKVAELDAAGLAAAMTELEAIGDQAARAGTYAMLAFSVDTADPSRGALLQRAQEIGTRAETKLLFFELEWAALDDERADALLADDALERWRHHLRMERRYRPHRLSESEEKILTEKAVTGSSAWSRLFSELVSAIEVGDAQEPLDVALSRLQDADREVRRSTAEAVTAALEPGLRTRAYVFNTLLADKATDDRLRSFPTWLSARNLSNQVSDESVQALVTAVKARYALPQRWYAVKARILGLEKLADYDRAAAVVADEDDGWTWDASRELVLDSFGAFDPRLADTARRFFDEGWIDAPVRPGKRGGAFCSYATPSVHPYVLLNWTAKRNDVLTLAHELGHGVHAALAAPRGLLEQGTPLTVAETASVFGEALVFGRLLEQAPDPQSRLSLLAEAIEGAIATVFRQTAMNQFEDSVHRARREEGELSVERFGDLWATSQHELFGDAVEVTDGYRAWWSYVPHFISTPGYVYAYAYGQLLALSVYGRYEQEGAGFADAYLEMLAAGGSMLPEDLGRIVGVDLADPGFWDAGLDLVQRQLDAAEQAARDAGHEV